MPIRRPHNASLPQSVDDAWPGAPSTSRLTKTAQLGTSGIRADLAFFLTGTNHQVVVGSGALARAPPPGSCDGAELHCGIPSVVINARRAAGDLRRLKARRGRNRSTRPIGAAWREPEEGRHIFEIRCH